MIQNSAAPSLGDPAGIPGWSQLGLGLLPGRIVDDPSSGTSVMSQSASD